MKYLDLRSDTVTMPTPDMRRAMMECDVGDDVYGDDPTVKRLEAMAAEAMGKEAALFVISGTMGNQVSIMTHTQYGNEIIAGAQSHIVRHECGAAARLSGVSYALADNSDTFIYAEDVRRLYREQNIHFPNTGLLCLENALCNGDVVPLDILYAACDAAHELNIPVHLDGARVFNAAIALGCEAKDITARCDSVSFCISKGLCAPVGALICGSGAFIEKARGMRKIVGGGARQAGVLAACGILAIDVMAKRLKADHDNARLLAEKLCALPDISVDMDKQKINMVFWKAANPKFSSGDFCKFMLVRGIKVSGSRGEAYRFAVHNDIKRVEIDTIIGHMSDYIQSIA